MIEPVMYFGIGFLVAALLCLLFVPLVHNRAVRLTMKRLEAATPLSIAEIRADKDQLRAEFAMSTRRLEMSVEKMKTKTTTQLAELGKKTDAINQLKKELGEKTATIFALEARDKTLRDQLRATEEEFQIKSGSLREAERHLADKEAELTKLLGELGERSLDRRQPAHRNRGIPHPGRGDEGQRRRLRTRGARRPSSAWRANAPTPRPPANELTAARGKLGDLGTRTTDLERQLFVQTDRSRDCSTAASRISKRGSAIRAACSPSAIISSTACAASSTPRARPRPICAANWPPPAAAAARRWIASVPISPSSKRSSPPRSKSAPSCSARSAP